MTPKEYNQRNITNIIGGVLFTALLFLLTIILISQSRFVYFSLFETHDVYSNFILEDTQQLEVEFNSVIDYISPPFSAQLNDSFFSEEDILHMNDVRNMFIVMYFLEFLIVVVLGLMTFFSVVDPPKIFKYAQKSMRFSMTLILTLSALFLLFWEQAFQIFHRILFPFNSYWLLDPATSNLIKFLPGGVFQTLLVLLLAGWFLIFILIETFLLRGRINKNQDTNENPHKE